MLQIIDLMITWGPTILFCLILLGGFLRGFFGGLRRSRIHLLHIVIAGAIAVTVFILFTSVEYFDALLLSFINKDSLNLSNPSEITTLKQALVSIIPSAVSQTDKALGIALSENSAYLLAIVNLIYNVVFFIISFVIYWIVRYVLFLLYIVFYPEWRYKIKRNNKLHNNKASTPYKKRRLRGGLLSLCCAIIGGIICLSCFGNIFYLVAGTGEEGLPTHDFGDKDTNSIYSAVNSLESYGDSGVYKLLNLPKDSNGMPIYLYVGAFPFSGTMDKGNGQTERIYLSHEIGNYTVFIKDMASIVLKYDSQLLDGMLSGEEVSTDTIVSLLENKPFRNDFRVLLSKYVNKSTFVGDFLFGVIDSYVANINDSSVITSFSADAKEILNILFSEGYTSDVIPFERTYEGDALPCIKLSDLMSKKDLLVVYDTFIDILDAGFLGDNTDYIDLVLTVAPHIDDLKFFSTENPNHDSINGTLGRLYAYVETKIFEEEPSKTIVNYSSHIEVDWLDELVELINMTSDLKVFYNVFNDPDFASYSVTEIMEKTFDDPEVLASYDKVVDFICNSGIASTVISSKFVSGQIDSLLADSFENYTQPEGLTYTNYKTDSGEVVYGELYNFLKVFRNIGIDRDFRDVLDTILNSSEVDLIPLVKDSQKVLTKPDDKSKTIIQYLTQSKLLRAVTSSFIFTLAEPDDAFIYIPDASREIDSNGELTYLIKENEFSLIFNTIFTAYGETNKNNYGLIDCISDDFDINNPDYALLLDNNVNIFANENVHNLLTNSLIIQASVGNVITDNSDTLIKDIVLPDSLCEPDDWTTKYDENGEVISTSEIVKVFDSLHELFEDSSIISDLENELENKLTSDTIKTLNHPSKVVDFIVTDGQIVESPSRTQVILNSDIIRHSISKLVTEKLPDDFDPESIELSKDEEGAIKVSEFVALIDVLDVLDINDVSNEEEYDKVDDLLNDVSSIISPVSYGYNDTKNEVMLKIFYESSVIRYYFSSILDDNLKSVFGEDDADVSKLDYVKDDDGLYGYDEVEKLIKGLLALDFNGSDDGSGLDNAGNHAVDMFSELNDYISHEDYPLLVKEGQSIQRLAVVYDSRIVELVLTDSIQEEIETNDMLQDHPEAYVTVTGNGGNYQVYKYAELSALVSLLNGKTINGDGVDDKFTKEDLSLYRIKTDFFEDKQCISKLLLSSISYNVISNGFVDNNQLIIPSTALLNVDELVIIKDAELYDVLDFADSKLGLSSAGDFDDDTFDFDNKVNDLSLVNDVKPFIQKSEIIRATVSDKVYQTSQSGDILIIPSSAMEDDERTDTLISFAELSNLIDFSSQVIQIDSINSIDSSEGFEDTSRFGLSGISTFLEKDNNDIIRATVSKKVVNIGDPLIIPNSTFETSQMLKKGELVNLINFATGALGGDSVGSISDKVNSDSSFNLSEIELYISGNDTLINRATVSNKILGVTALDIPSLVIDDVDTSVKIIKEIELVNLLDVTNEIGLNSVEQLRTINVNSLTLVQAKGFVAQSEIIRTTASMRLVEKSGSEDNYLVVPFNAQEKQQDSTYKNEIIVTERNSAVDGSIQYVISIKELNNLFDALNAVGVGNIQDAHNVDESTIDPKHYSDGVSEMVSKSAVLRATITEHVSFGDLVIKALKYEIDVNIDAVNHTGLVRVLHDHEVLHLLDDFTIYRQSSHAPSNQPLTCNLDLTILSSLYNDGYLDEMLQSDMFRIAVSDVLIKAGASIVYEEDDVYGFTEPHDTTADIASVEVILSFFALIG